MTAVGQPDTRVSGSDLAVLVLQTSWALADAAHDLPAGRMSGQRREELADTLQALGYALRVSAPDGERPGPQAPETKQHLGTETGAGQRRGWCVASCGCAVDVPLGGGVHVDCPACEPLAATAIRAGHQGAAPSAGDRPEPS